MPNISDLRPSAPAQDALKPSPAHPHPTQAEAEERGKMRRAASDGLQSAIWICCLVLITGVVVGAVLYFSSSSRAANGLLTSPRDAR
ncbi:MAG: hypothetical protein SFV15_10585 [Polyangiaceae bacterium]|nr:hypothetical protein [Polyangiaceae bacterium]